MVRAIGTWTSLRITVAFVNLFVRNRSELNMKPRLASGTIPVGKAARWSGDVLP